MARCASGIEGPFVIKPMNSLMKRMGMAKEETPTRACPECVSEIPATATRCMYCAIEVEPTIRGAAS